MTFYILEIAVVALLVMGIVWVVRTTWAAGKDGDVPGSLVGRDDDGFWLGGILYYNPNDPALLVPRRFGIGWTLNLGNPRSWLLLTAMVALAVVPAVIKRIG